MKYRAERTVKVCLKEQEWQQEMDKTKIDWYLQKG